MRPGSQKKPFIFFNPFLLIMYLSFLFTGCTLFGIKNKLSPTPNKDIESSYYQNGNLEYEAEYINGKLDGTSRVWSEDGSLFSESEYSHGQPHGTWKKFHPNGSLMYEVQYEFGQKHGDEKWYYENKQLKSEQKFSYGNTISEMVRWNPDGILIY